MGNQSFVSGPTRTRIRGLAVPIALALGRLGLTPNALTVIGFAGTCAAAVAAGLQAWAVGGVLVLAFGIFDLFDGALARATGRASLFGAFLDSTLDRLGENIVYAGIAFGTAEAGFQLGTLLAGLAMATASVVTYARARAEAVGLHGEVGIAPRPERLVVLSIGLVATGIGGGDLGPLMVCPVASSTSDCAWAGSPWLAIALAVIVVTSVVTIVQRIVHVQRQARARATGQPALKEE
ncbi:MAG TPA: CDP-alcohol phosphatidyltransferase family protein [Candidatus Limnocylindrales bacterium]